MTETMFTDVTEAPAPKRLTKEFTDPPRSTSKRRPAAGRERAEPSSARKQPTKPTQGVTEGKDYREGILGALQVPAAILAGLGTVHRPFLADSCTILATGPLLADALNDLAKEQSQVAAVLDYVVKMGPYSALVGAVGVMVAQFATNHKPALLVLTDKMGAVDPEQLIARTVGNAPSPNGANANVSA